MTANQNPIHWRNVTVILVARQVSDANRIPVVIKYLANGILNLCCSLLSRVCHSVAEWPNDPKLSHGAENRKRGLAANLQMKEQPPLAPATSMRRRSRWKFGSHEFINGNGARWQGGKGSGFHPNSQSPAVHGLIRCPGRGV